MREGNEKEDDGGMKTRGEGGEEEREKEEDEEDEDGGKGGGKEAMGKLNPRFGSMENAEKGIAHFNFFAF